MFLWALAGLSLMVTIIGLMFPSRVVVSRAVDIQAPKDSIKAYLSDLQRWKSWMKGMEDSNSTVLNEKEARIGNTYVTLLNMPQGSDSIPAIWKTNNNGTLISFFQLVGTAPDKPVTLHWEFEQHIGWLPWERFSSMLTDKILGTMMEKDLNNIKEITEGNHG